MNRFSVRWFVGSLCAAALIGWLLGNLPIMVLVAVIGWVVFAISLVPSGGVRGLLYVTLVVLLGLSVYNGWFSKKLPMTVRALEDGWQRLDVRGANRYANYTTKEDSALVEARRAIDVVHDSQFQTKLQWLEGAVQSGWISVDSAMLILDSLAQHLDAYGKTQAGKILRQAAQHRSPTQTVEAALPETATYNVYDRRLRVAKVPPQTKVVLTATTGGYTCDPNIGLVQSIEGMDYYPDGMEFKEGFPARNARVFCLLARLDDQPPQAFVDGTCTFYNDTDDTVDCYVLVNDRNDWSDNSGTIQITHTLIAL